MRKNPTDKQKLVEIYREVVACHYYSDGGQYCADLLNISLRRVYEIARRVRGRKILDLHAKGASNKRIAEAIGCDLSRVEGLIRTALYNERQLRWTA